MLAEDSVRGEVPRDVDCNYPSFEEDKYNLKSRS